MVSPCKHCTARSTSLSLRDFLRLRLTPPATHRSGTGRQQVRPRARHGYSGAAVLAGKDPHQMVSCRQANTTGQAQAQSTHGRSSGRAPGQLQGGRDTVGAGEAGHQR